MATLMLNGLYGTTAIQVSIHETGIGLDAEHHKLVFEK